MLPFHRVVAFPRSIDPLYRLQTVYNRFSQQNVNYTYSPNPVYFHRPNIGILEPPFRVRFQRPLYTCHNSLNQLNLKDSELNIQQYFEQVKSQLNSNEIHQQRPVNNIRFIEYENIFAYNVMKDMKEYQQTVGQILKYELPRLPGLPDNLNHYIFEPNLTDELSDDLGALIERIKTMNAMEVIQFQKHFLTILPFSSTEAEWEQVFFESNFCKIWNVLDTVATNLLETSPLETSLYEFLAISGLWFELGLATRVIFNRTLIRKLFSYNRDLDKVSLIHLMFNLNINRFSDLQQSHSAVSTVASCLNRFEDLTLDELSVIGMGFFKTKTRMPYSLLSKFIHLCTGELSNCDSPISSTIGVASVLKSIRFSLDSNMFDARHTRDDVKALVNAIIDHQGSIFDSNICLTHIILLLNSAYLQNSKKLYKNIFDRMMSNLSGFRIKDIERILFCFANVLFLCANYKLKELEDYLVTSEQSQLYPFHVYNIIYFLMTLNFYPHKLIQMCADQEFLARAVDNSKIKLSDTLLIADTMLRLELRNRSILTTEQINKHNERQMKDAANFDTKKSRFIKRIYDIFEKEFSNQARLMYLFPFAKNPFPVILTEEAAQQIRMQPSESIYQEAVPYTFEHLNEGQFRNCTAIFTVLTKDKTYGSNIRGFASVNKRLLERLGFRVVQVEQRDFTDFILPSHFQLDAHRYQRSVQSLLASVRSLSPHISKETPLLKTKE